MVTILVKLPFSYHFSKDFFNREIVAFALQLTVNFTQTSLTLFFRPYDNHHLTLFP